MVNALSNNFQPSAKSETASEGQREDSKIPIAVCLLRSDIGIRWPCASIEESSGVLKHLQGSDQPNKEYLTADYNYNSSMDGLSGH